ncbi:unnamed protein product [Phyllotreta striolata]|uniref:Cytosol aminopeptidase n=1 Tax=Phyllotreta striolata TaxID=444603 RepID=A0A9N9TJX9_PHYSR|nr:unnamed protein product [Phyllotreta striolata]
MALCSHRTKFIRLGSHINNFVRFSSCQGFSGKGLVLGVHTTENNEVKLTPAAEKYNELCEGKLLQQIQLTGNDIKPGKCVLFWGLDKEFNSVAVAGLGKDSEPTDDDIELICNKSEAIRIAAAAGCRALDSAGIKNIHVEDFGDADAAAQGSALSVWKFQEYKTDKKPLANVELSQLSRDQTNWRKGITKAEAQNLARKLTDTPANLLDPTVFSEEAKRLLSPLGVDVKIYDKKWAEDQKMFSFLAVAQGSAQPPKFLEITYNPADSKQPPAALVGKGVTFDAGGISLKPSASMDEMRGDMGGAAVVIGTVFGLAKLGVPANLKVLVPLVENLPSGTAIKPGDVIRARNGKTICVDNTDAEGRLILADALSYSGDFKPKWVLDIATLTGAMRVALGNAATGVFANNNKLYEELEEAGRSTGDRVWRMPLWKHYTKIMCEHDAYDLNNIGKGAKGGGSCTAAAFLREFAPKDTPWLHLDIAGVMGPDASAYLQKGMTGRPTRTIIEFIERETKTV